jgi:hypothetical protein
LDPAWTLSCYPARHGADRLRLPAETEAALDALPRQSMALLEKRGACVTDGDRLDLDATSALTLLEGNTQRQNG